MNTNCNLGEIISYNEGEKKVELVRTGRRRAAQINGNDLIVFRLRKAGKDGTQKIRDIVKVYKCQSADDAQAVLTGKIRMGENQDQE